MTIYLHDIYNYYIIIMTITNCISIATGLLNLAYSLKVDSMNILKR